jgi:hypothetical protein
VVYDHVDPQSATGRDSTYQKGGLSSTEYFNKMKALADMLAIIGQPLKDEEFIAYLLAGLDESYDSLVTSITTRDDPIPLSELFAYLLNDALMKM